MATPLISPRLDGRERPPLPTSDARSAVTRPTLSLAYRLSTAVVIVGAFTSAIGVVHPAIFRETAWTTGNA